MDTKKIVIFVMCGLKKPDRRFHVVSEENKKELLLSLHLSCLVLSHGAAPPGAAPLLPPSLSPPPLPHPGRQPPCEAWQAGRHWG